MGIDGAVAESGGHGSSRNGASIQRDVVQGTEGKLKTRPSSLSCKEQTDTSGAILKRIINRRAELAFLLLLLLVVVVGVIVVVVVVVVVV